MCLLSSSPSLLYGCLAPPALTMLSLETIGGKRNAHGAGGDDDERLDASSNSRLNEKDSAKDEGCGDVQGGTPAEHKRRASDRSRGSGRHALDEGLHAWIVREAAEVACWDHDEEVARQE